MTEQALTRVRQLLATAEPAGLGPGPRPGVLPAASLTAALESLPGAGQLSAAKRTLLRALVFLWHDHLDEAHTIAQGIDSADGSYLHAIMHRREPDYWNAKYWFRRVGEHPAYRQLAKRVDALLKQREPGDLPAKLLPRGRWDAIAFVDVGEQAERGGAAELRELLREIQRIEFEVLLDEIVASGYRE